MSLYLSLHLQKLLFTSYIHEDGCPTWVLPRHCSSFWGFTMNCRVTQGLCRDQAPCTCLYFQGGVWLSLCLGLRSWQRCLSSSSWCYLCRLQPCRAPAGAAPTGTNRVGARSAMGQLVQPEPPVRSAHPQLVQTESAVSPGSPSSSIPRVSKASYFYTWA